MTEKRYFRLQQIAGPVSRETFDRLTAFESLFLRWAKRINLAAPSTLNDVWERHILDSAQLLALAPDARHWLDVGSGGGFPGAVLAVLLAEKEGARIELIESNRKKAAFLASSLQQLGVRPIVHARRIETCYDLIETPDVVTARAVAPLPRLLELTHPWVTAGAMALFHKGRDYQKEIEESGNAWQFDLLKHPDRVDAEAVILELRRLQRLDRTMAVT